MSWYELAPAGLCEQASLLALEGDGPTQKGTDGHLPSWLYAQLLGCHCRYQTIAQGWHWDVQSDAENKDDSHLSGCLTTLQGPLPANHHSFMLVEGHTMTLRNWIASKNCHK